MYRNNESKKKRQKQLKLWRVLAFVFLVLACILLVALIVVVVMKSGNDDGASNGSKVEQLIEEKKKSQPESCSPKLEKARSDDKGNKVFGGLTSNETEEIMDWLLEKGGLSLIPVENSTIRDNYVYAIEDYLPEKNQVVSYLDSASRNARQPDRKAKVTVFLGKTKKVEEYLVWPIPRPTRKQKVNTNKVSWKARPVAGPEVKEVYEFGRTALVDAETIIHISFAPDCKHWTDCLHFNVAQRSSLDANSNQRSLIVWFFVSSMSIADYYLYSIPLYIVLTYENNDTLKISKFFYNGRAYDSVKEFTDKYYQDTSFHYRLPKIGKHPYGSPEYTPDGTTADQSMRPPEQFYPDGARFKVSGKTVEWLKWSFVIHSRTLAGMQLFNIKHGKERIAYELSMQDIVVTYSGAAPDDFFKTYFDNSWATGRENKPLIRGVDCPNGAVYMNSTVFNIDHDAAKEQVDAICIFENRNSVPMRHHYSTEFYTGGYRYAFSMPDTVLVVRQILTLWNYDYILDYEFHQNGVIELKVSSTGYIAVTNFLSSDNMNDFKRGFVVNPDWGSVANLHHHIFNFKLDLDIDGTANSFKTINIEQQRRSTDFSSQDWYMMELTETQITNEKSALFRYDFENPRMYIMYNNNKKLYNSQDKYNPPKSYRISSNGFAKVMLPDESPMMAGGLSFAKYQVAVSRQKDNERTTSSFYNQGDPFNPGVKFDDFFDNDESLVQHDLVAWVSVGLYHAPTYEDLPVTTTPGKTVSVTLTPFNYFKRDPSIHSRDAAVFWHPYSNKTDSYLQKNASCMPIDRPPVVN